MDERDELEEKIASEMEELAVSLWESVVDESLMEESGGEVQFVLAALLANANARAGVTMEGRLTMEGLLEFDREEEMVAAAEITWHHFLTLWNLEDDARADLWNQVAHGIWVIAMTDWENAQETDKGEN